MALLLLVAACAAPDNASERPDAPVERAAPADTGAAAAAEESFAADTGGAADAGRADAIPWIVSVDRVECSAEGAMGDVWQLALTVDDPQGASTVVAGEAAVVASDGSVLAAYGLMCGRGACVGNFAADYDGIVCDMRGAVVLRFTVTDADGNVSEPLEQPTL